jgi:Raf kinase inhibitor-like YbhB/YbcL family protein
MRTRRPNPLILAVALLLVPFVYLRSCPRHPTPNPQYESKEGNPMSPANQSFTLTSPAFFDGGEIPRRYTCDDADQSPDLAWSGAPANTQSLALIADDPDAPMGTWTHWLIWNLPPKASVLPSGVPKDPILGNTARQGLNDFHRIGYGGPCPPPGKPHRYFFKLYALDARLDLKPGASKSELEHALKPHILAQTQLMATYKR